MKLTKSNVVFNEDEHTYTLGDLTLSGITSIIGKYVCPNKYDGIPPYILEKARVHGSLVHKQLELEVNGFPCADVEPEVLSFRKLIVQHDIKPLEGEFLVSDELHFATKIDLVTDDLRLIDYKTTSKLDMEYLAWQLSIDAYLFERQTGEHVDSLYAMHVRGEKVAELVPIIRLEDAYVESLLNAWINGVSPEEWVNPVPFKFEVSDYEPTDEDVAIMDELAAELEVIEGLEAELAPHQKRVADLKATLDLKLRDGNSLKFASDKYNAYRTKDSSYMSVDTAALKKNYADVYAAVCTKPVKRSGTFKFSKK